MTMITNKAHFLGMAFGVASSVLVTTASLVACGDDSTPSPVGTTDGGSSGADTGSSGSTDSGGTTDTGPASVQGCTNFVDKTADNATREIKWDLQVAATPEHCTKIKVGQKVKWGDGSGGSADFSTHPLVASGGDTPNPISGAGSTGGEATFAAKGTFGFVCGNHSSMVGAIKVE